MPSTSLSKIDRIALKLSVRKLTGTCCICGRKVYSSHSIYCLRCFHFVRRMDQRGLHAKAVKAILKYVKKYGFVCYYTGIDLDLNNPKSAWYYEFDHFRPGDDRKIVLTCAVINEMKSVLSIKEFWDMVEQLADYIRTGKKIKKIRLASWQRRGPHLKAILRIINRQTTALTVVVDRNDIVRIKRLAQKRGIPYQDYVAQLIHRAARSL